MRSLCFCLSVLFIAVFASACDCQGRMLGGIDTDNLDASVPGDPDASVPDDPDASIPSDPDASTPGDPDASVPECDGDEDCPDDEICVDGNCECAYECCGDEDCPEGMICDEDGNCVCDGDPGDDPCAEGKTLLCHYPQGNPSNAHAICVSDSAVPAHQAHGDTLGTCP